MSFDQYLFKKQRRLNIGCNFVLHAAFLLFENLSLSLQIEILYKIDQWNWFYEQKWFFVQFKPGPFHADVEFTMVFVAARLYVRPCVATARKHVQVKSSSGEKGYTKWLRTKF